MTGKEFRRTVEDHIHSETEGSLEEGRHECIIKERHTPMGFGKLDDPFNIGDIEQRIGGSLHIDHLCIRANGAGDFVKIFHVDK